jgi:hypothetical protein
MKTAVPKETQKLIQVPALYPELETVAPKRVLIDCSRGSYYINPTERYKMENHPECVDDKSRFVKLLPIIEKLTEWLVEKNIPYEFYHREIKPEDWDAIIVSRQEITDTLRAAKQYCSLWEKTFLEFPKEKPTPLEIHTMLWLTQEARYKPLLHRFFIMRKSQRAGKLCLENT